jgi:DNA-binding IclR family transcriptional regulator
VLLKCLTSLGYLSFDPDTMHYFPSLRVTSLGAWNPGWMYGMGDAASMLQEVHDVTGETVTLSMRSGQSIAIHPGSARQVLHCTEDGRRHTGATVRLQRRRGLACHASRSGNRAACRVRPLDGAVRGRARTAIDQAIAAIPQIRACGYSVAYASLFPDTGAVSMPMPPATDGAVLVLGVGGLSERIRRNEKAIARIMRNAISRRTSCDPAATDLPCRTDGCEPLDRIHGRRPLRLAAGSLQPATSPEISTMSAASIALQPNSCSTRRTMVRIAETDKAVTRGLSAGEIMFQYYPCRRARKRSRQEWLLRSTPTTSWRPPTRIHDIVAKGTPLNDVFAGALRTPARHLQGQGRTDAPVGPCVGTHDHHRHRRRRAADRQRHRARRAAAQGRPGSASATSATAPPASAPSTRR